MKNPDPKFHVSTATGKAGPCDATERACRFLKTFKHYNTMKEAQAAADTAEITAAIQETLAPHHPPIIVPKSPYIIPASQTEFEAVGVSYAFDFYETAYYCNCDDDEPHRCSEYEGLRVDEVGDWENSLKRFFGMKGKLPEELKEVGLEAGLDCPEGYEVKAVPGYYGDEAEISLSRNARMVLEEWAYSKNNANDQYGALDYCRSKGLDTTGLTPMEAIKKQIRNEGRNKVLPEMDDAKSLTRFPRFPISLITIPNEKRYGSAKPRPAISYTDGETVDGIVLSNRNGDYILLDGYRRFKDLTTVRNKKHGNFLVLQAHHHRF